MIKINGLTKKFGELVVFENINAHIKKGECIAVIGPSGTGKSIFFRTIAMLERPDRGNIFIDGTDITQKGVDLNRVHEKMGMVYQGFHLFSHLNILNNITLAPRLVRKKSKEEAEMKAMELLSLVGLTDKANSFPHELSGGQQQRIAIARSLAMEPEIILFDEPTSALDPTMTCEVLSIIRKLTKMGLTILIVTHEMHFAREISDRVFYMDEGGIYEEGTPDEIFDRPQKEKTKAFVKKLKVFQYEISSKSFDMVSMNAQIEVFCQKYNLGAKQVYSIQLFLEELIVVLFNKCYETTPPEIKFTIEYSDETNRISIYLIYLATDYNPFEYIDNQIDNLGMMLIRKMSEKSGHLYENGRNSIVIELKK
jgi:polar amino acid transport system ATP-binding protein